MYNHRYLMLAASALALISLIRSVMTRRSRSALRMRI